ncbi:hypothetical protein K1719_035684 [Acacia pycnantha]|nr:hypothetical protein K1719_035684 [Acacia pycnantha]
MKLTLVLDRITHWQKLLDRAIETSPIGAAQNNTLIKISLYAIVKESFDLYRDISDGLSVILDNFFHLPHKACVIAFEVCVKSSTQFDELSRFYALCVSLGIGSKFEYPCVQKVSNELMEPLQEFLKDQASFSTSNNVRLLSPPCDSKHKLLPPPLPNDTGSISSQDEANEQPGAPSKSSEQVEQHDSQVRDQEQKDTISTPNHGSTDSWDSMLDEITSIRKQGEQHDSQTRDQEQKNTTSSSNNVTQTQYNPFVENTTDMAPSTTEIYDPAPIFHGSVPMVIIAQNPFKVAIAPTFTGQCYYNFQTCFAQTLGDLNGMKTSPTFTPQVNFRTRMVAEPTFHGQSLNTITTEPAFHIPGSYKIGSTSPTFHANNETTSDPTLSTQNRGLMQ